MLNHNSVPSSNVLPQLCCGFFFFRSRMLCNNMQCRDFFKRKACYDTMLPAFLFVSIWHCYAMLEMLQATVNVARKPQCTQAALKQKPHLKEGSLNCRKIAQNLWPFIHIFTETSFSPEACVFTKSTQKKPVEIYVAPYSRPVPYSQHPPYSRHFFNETHENDPVWALFPIAVSDDPFSTQVCKEILSILSFLEKLFSSIKPVFAWRFILPLNILLFEIPR